MLAVKQNSLNSGVVPAVLTVDVSYVLFDVPYFIKAGTECLLDLSCNIALVGDQHIQLYAGMFEIGSYN